MNVLVTDGENRSALAVTRSLGKKGCRVFVVGKGIRNLSSCSKYCFRRFVVPDPFIDGPKYVAAIVEIVRRDAIEIVFPMTDEAIYLLNQARDMFPGCTILACPSEEITKAIADKSNVFHLAERLNVPIPKTLHLSGPGDLSEIIEQIDRFPVVVKPALSKIFKGNGFISARVIYAFSRVELEELYKTNNVLCYPSMIQEKIVGPGTGLFTLYDVDHHLALFSHRRLREKPPSGGVSVVSESVPLDEEMVESAGRLLSAVGWSGVVMVEFKRDLRDGKAKLMEINGRFWGSLQLAIDCGVDFPCLLLDYLLGKSPPAQIRNYQEGHKLKWVFGTLDHLLIRLKNRREMLNISPELPSRRQAVVDFLKVWEKDTSFDVFDRNDQGPFWFEGCSYLRQALRDKR